MLALKNSVFPVPALLLTIAGVAFCMMQLLAELLTSDCDESALKIAIIYTIAACMSSDYEDNTDDERPAKHQCVNYDRHWAKMSIQQDYLSPYPIFDDHQFKCMFRVSKSIYETICAAVRLHPFF